jgi:peptidoglycan hydrolase-like protein with peptidoglycan-binding domain
MSEHITGSVGISGRNNRTDVSTVQRLLNGRGYSVGRVDGVCGPKTTNGILAFQHGFLSRPDGRIDPGGITWKQLTGTSGGVRTPSSPTRPPVAPPASGAQSLTTRLPRPDRTTLNPGLAGVTSAFMVQTLGNPRQSYGSDCRPVTNPTLQRHIVSESVGPFRVSGFRPAVNSLRTIMGQIQQQQPAVYGALGTAGMLCCRYIRGSTSAISNHSWGTAIDLTLNGVLDQRGDNQVQVGLALIAPIFNANGWLWGAAFRTEDAMHFEAGRALISQWASAI